MFARAGFLRVRTNQDRAVGKGNSSPFPGRSRRALSPCSRTGRNRRWREDFLCRRQSVGCQPNDDMPLPFRAEAGATVCASADPCGRPIGAGDAGLSKPPSTSTTNRPGRSTGYLGAHMAGTPSSAWPCCCEVSWPWRGLALGWRGVGGLAQFVRSCSPA